MTELLLQWRQGNRGAEEQLFPLLYDELRRIARFHMRGERADHTLQPTALVHEAYARLINMELTWQDRAHFLRIAARTMRRILVDHARARRREKRGGAALKITLHDAPSPSTTHAWDVVDLDLALQRLHELDERQDQVVELHYFGGLSYVEIAEAMQISRATVARDLRDAKLWLRRELSA